MLSAFLLALREGVEIALILSIVLGTLKRLNREILFPVVWAGAICAGAASITIAIMLHRVGASLSGATEAVFEGITMLFAALILTWMIFWMQIQAQSITNELETGVRKSVFQASRWALFSLAFVAVVREGTELAFFFTATTFASNLSAALIGTLLGLTASAAFGIALFTASIRMNLKLFFQVTGALLILFAAGLVGHGIHESSEVGLLPAIIEQVWDLSFVLDDQSVFGSILKVLFGYNANPSLLETLAYILYLSGVFFFLKKRKSIELVSQKA